jgi:hypothetical protein
MGIIATISAAIEFLSEGVAQIFSPRNDQYPAIGVQPFDDEPLSEWVDLTRR